MQRPRSTVIQPMKKRCVGSSYRQQQSMAAGSTYSNSEALDRYFNIPIDEEVTNVIEFWSNRQDLHSIARLALQCLSVPATSAPVERVFSHGGIIMVPKRSRLTSDHLCSLIYLKCNRSDSSI